MDAQFFGLRIGYARTGDRVRILSTKARGPDDADLGTYPVVAANSRHLKLEDRRVFSQAGGGPLYSGRSSPIRALVVR